MITRRYSLITLSVAILGGMVGCATKTAEVHQFTPVPTARVGAQELKPAKPTATLDLLKAADAAFRKGNALQEKGQKGAALKEYNRFLELLVEADLDPSVFRSLRKEFERILSANGQGNQLWAKLNHSKLTPEQIARTNVSGDLDIPAAFTDRIETQIAEIQNYYPKVFQAGLDRSGKYLPYIRAQFAKAGLPTDLAWLAMVESAFNPTAHSPAAAQGMWQFIRQTGARYNLHVNRYVDERNNWKKATAAAIAYLKDMNERFQGNWPVTIAAYNMGEFGMERLIASNGGNADLLQLIETPPASNQMMSETKKYYPKLLATIIVAANPTKFGFEPSHAVPDDCVSVPVKGCFSLAVLDRACGLPEGTLGGLNPDLIRGVTPPNREFDVQVPSTAKDKFIDALANVPQERPGRHGRFSSIMSRFTSFSHRRRARTHHVVRHGETLSGIANRYGVPVDDLIKANKIRRTTRLMPGKRLTIPAVAPQPTAQPAEPAAETARTYTVKQGDTLYDIAKLQGLSLKDLQNLNNLQGSSSIHVGDKLILSPGSRKGAAPAGPTKTTYKVKKGDTPSSIARANGVSLEDLVKWNHLGKRPRVILGHDLVIYTSGAPASHSKLAKADFEKSPPDAAAKAAARVQSKTTHSAAHASKTHEAKNSEKIVHKVAKGETATSIAAKYGVSVHDFLKWNHLTDSSVLRIGDEYTVYVTKKSELARATTGASRTASSRSASTTSQTSRHSNRVTTHTVAKGENPSTIARRYHVSLRDLFKWNNWTKNPTLQIGDTVTIHSNK